MMSAPLARTSAGFIAFTVAAVPTGMKAGVLISPRFIAMIPVRAASSVAAMVKAKRLIACKPCPAPPCRCENIRPFSSLRRLLSLVGRHATVAAAPVTKRRVDQHEQLGTDQDIVPVLVQGSEPFGEFGGEFGTADLVVPIRVEIERTWKRPRIS